MNVMLLLAQVAPALTDSIAGANPVLTQVNASDEMNLWSMAVKGGWIMVVLGLMSVLCFYILFERMPAPAPRTAALARCTAGTLPAAAAHCSWPPGPVPFHSAAARP